MDRRPLTLGDLIEPAPPMDLTQAPVSEFEEDRTGIRAGSSAKIDQLVKLLQLNPPADKSLVFSQFTSFLDKVSEGRGGWIEVGRLLMIIWSVDCGGVGRGWVSNVQLRTIRC